VCLRFVEYLVFTTTLTRKPDTYYPTLPERFPARRQFLVVCLVTSIGGVAEQCARQSRGIFMPPNNFVQFPSHLNKLPSTPPPCLLWTLMPQCLLRLSIESTKQVPRKKPLLTPVNNFNAHPEFFAATAVLLSTAQLQQAHSATTV